MHNLSLSWIQDLRPILVPLFEIHWNSSYQKYFLDQGQCLIGMGAMGGHRDTCPPWKNFGGGHRPPKKIYKKEKIYKKWSKKSIKKEKIYKKWSKNASREVQKSKIFLPRRRGHPFSWTSLVPPLENFPLRHWPPPPGKCPKHIHIKVKEYIP